MIENENQPVETLILEIMKVQRKYGHEYRNVKVERQEKMKEAIERFAKAAS